MSDVMSEGKPPLLSIVTVSFRNPGELLATLRSTEMLDSTAVERIVIDGSPDQSCANIIAQCDIPIAHYVHEADNGIYDAMNKGIRLARGDAVIMLNSGDLLYDTGAFSTLLSSVRDKLATHVIYGQTIDRFCAADVERSHVLTLSKDDIRRGEIPSHQSTLVPTAFCQANPYDTSFKSAADTAFLRKAYLALPALAVATPISIFSYGGRSNARLGLSQVLPMYREHVRARSLTVKERSKIFAHLGVRSLLGYVLGTQRHRALQARRAQVRSAGGAE